MTLRTLPARFAGLLAGCIVAALIASPAQAGARYGDTHVTIHESIQVKGSAAAIWARKRVRSHSTSSSPSGVST